MTRNTVLESRILGYLPFYENEHVVGTLSRFHLLRPRRKRVTGDQCAQSLCLV